LFVVVIIVVVSSSVGSIVVFTADEYCSRTSRMLWVPLCLWIKDGSQIFTLAKTKKTRRNLDVVVVLVV